MAAPLSQLGQRERDLVDRVVAHAEADPSFAAVVIVGSRAAGSADAFSDLDLFFVVEDDSYDAVVAGRDQILPQFDELLWSESWGRPECWFFIFASGVEGDLTVVRAGEAATALTGPFVVVWDRQGVLDGAGVSPVPPPAATGTATLERLLRGFWHEFGHLTKALGRGQLWWASGQLEVVRGMCVSLLRLSTNFDDPEVGDEPYWKIDVALTPEVLERLRPTLSGFERGAMLEAAGACLGLFRELAEPMADVHGLAYPEALDRLAKEQLAQIEP